MIRIITGKAKNVALRVPDITGMRSVQEVAKGSLFSILGDKVINANCLDLFAGSGNLGLESLSRGASHCDFVDNNRESYKIITENIKKCRFDDISEVSLRDVVKFVANTDAKYDIIFVDPFYDDHNHVFLMKNLQEILNPDGVICFFHGESLDLNKIIKDTDLKILDNRKFGKSQYTILNCIRDVF